MRTSLQVLFPLAALAAWLTAQPARADAPPELVIEHLGANGELTFTTVAGYTNYTVEWAPTVSGPWSDNWLALRQITPQAKTQTVSVPMFYRVVARGTPVVVPDGLAYVPFGAYLMGDNFSLAADATPIHLVEINAFFMEKREVTRALWDGVVAWANLRGYDIASPNSASPTNHPANEITWFDAIKWCNARSEKEGFSPVYYTSGAQTNLYRSGMLDLTNGCVNWAANGYRLPTEAEWERAARGGLEGQHYPWASSNAVPDDCIQGDYANYWNSGDPFDNDTTPVSFYNGAQSIGGRDMANGFGLYDMAGNVAEICWDRYDFYLAGAQLDPHGPNSGDLRVRRGGSWYDSISRLRCPSRQWFDPWVTAPNIGLRCVRKPE